MTDNDKKINDIIMQEVGLEVGPGNKIYDQDTGASLRINGSDVVAPGFYNGRKTIEFDPYNNRKMMNQLFSHFIEKISDESDVDVVAYYNVDNHDKGSGCVECSMSDNTKIKSAEYGRDTLKYADLIIQLNGGEANTLKEFDTPIEVPTVKKTRGGIKNGRTTKV